MHIAVELRPAEIIAEHRRDARQTGFCIYDADRKGLIIGISSVNHIKTQYQRRCYAAVHFRAIKAGGESRRTIADAVVVYVCKAGAVHGVGCRCGCIGQQAEAPGIWSGDRFGEPAFGHGAVVELFEHEIAGGAFAEHFDVVYAGPPGPGAAVVVADDELHGGRREKGEVCNERHILRKLRAGLAGGAPVLAQQVVVLAVVGINREAVPAVIVAKMHIHGHGGRRPAGDVESWRNQLQIPGRGVLAGGIVVNDEHAGAVYARAVAAVVLRHSHIPVCFRVAVDLNGPSTGERAGVEVFRKQNCLSLSG